MIFVLDRPCYYSLWYGDFCSPSYVCHRSGKIQVQNALFNVGEFHVDSGKNKALKKLRKSEISVQSI